MITLTDFLLARIAEDEELAQAVYDHDRWVVEEDGNGDEWVTEVDRADQHWRVAMLRRHGHAAHIARHDPARVLAECEAKRRIVEEAWKADDSLEDEYCGGHRREQRETDGNHDAPVIVRLLALPYADHPDYREEWRP